MNSGNYFKSFIYVLTILLGLNFVSYGEISVEKLKEHVYFLASDSLKGRKPGTPEGRLAAEYIKKNIIYPGVTFLGEDGFQYFEVTTKIQLGENNELHIGDFDGDVEKDYIPLGFTKNKKLKSKVIFVGYGLSVENDTVFWNDYQGVSVAGRWIMILRGHPEIEKRQSKFEQFAGLREKIISAQDQGAGGVLLVSGPAFDKEDKLLDLFLERNPATVNVPVLQIKSEVADLILNKNGNSVKVLEKRLMESGKPLSFDTEVEVEGAASVIISKSVTQNIIAILPGSDPLLKDEVIVLGAHYDHLGMGGPGSGSRHPETLAIHNGADDNASGVAAILEIFKMLCENRDKLKRSVLLISFGAEELGVIGSKYFIDHPLIALDKIKFMFNLDMIGRMDQQQNEFTLGGTGTAVGLEDILKKQAEVSQVKVNMSAEGLGPSDHASFYASDKSVLFFFTSPHQDYHTPDDDPQYLNYLGIQEIAEFAYNVILEIANRPVNLAFQEAGPKSRPSSRYGLRATLGLQPDHTAGDVVGMRVEAVTKGKPADLAGMKKGDVIVAIEGKEVNNIYDYMYRLKEFRPGDRISVEIKRNEKKQILIVQL